MHGLARRTKPYLLPVIPGKLFSPAPETEPASQQIASSKSIFIQDNENCWIVRVADLMLLESEGNYTRVYFGKSRPMMARSLNYLEERLDPSMFFRANRRSIINLRYVEGIEPWVNGGFLVRLRFGSEVVVSRRRGRLLKEMMTF